MTDAKRGRQGLLINPEAARHFLTTQDHSQAWLAAQAGMTEANVSVVLAAQKGVTRETADRIANALGVTTGHLFPELVEFKVAVRYFTASGAES